MQLVKIYGYYYFFMVHLDKVEIMELPLFYIKEYSLFYKHLLFYHYYLCIHHQKQKINHDKTVTHLKKQSFSFQTLQNPFISHLIIQHVT